MTRRLAAALLLVLATAGCRCSLSSDHCRVASFDCGQGRKISIYEDLFCDVGMHLTYEVRVGGRVVMPEYRTQFFFSCGDPMDPSLFRLIADETRTLFGVVYGEESAAAVGLVYDFDAELGVPRSWDDGGITDEQFERLGLAAP